MIYIKNMLQGDLDLGRSQQLDIDMANLTTKTGQYFLEEFYKDNFDIASLHIYRAARHDCTYRKSARYIHMDNNDQYIIDHGDPFRSAELSYYCTSIFLSKNISDLTLFVTANGRVELPPLQRYGSAYFALKRKIKKYISTETMALHGPKYTKWVNEYPVITAQNYQTFHSAPDICLGDIIMIDWSVRKKNAEKLGL